MKKIYTLLLIIVLFFTLSTCFSQITINQNDMPNENDTFRLSITTNLQSNDPALTGTNFIWDFASLIPVSQTIDTFISVLSTPVTYNVVFNNPFDQVHKASYATRDYNSINPIPNIQISEIYNFFKETSTSFTQVGQGAIVNGVATPMKYDIPSLIYSFPLQINNIDSSTSSFDMQIPTMGYYGQTIKRVNTVDGWGSLTTPLGTFDVIRTKSIINISDTIYNDTYMLGYRMSRPQETEYRWIADSKGIPILQINKQNITSTIRFQDNIITTGFKNLSFSNTACIIFPNPAKESFTVFSDTPYSKFEILDITGKIIITQKNKTEEINISKLTEGLYFIRLYDNNNTLFATKKINKE